MHRIWLGRLRMPPTSTLPAQTGFLRSVERDPESPCLRWDGGTLTYAQMADRAARIADSVGDAPRVAILADGTPTAYAGVLGTLMAGATYVADEHRAPRRPQSGDPRAVGSGGSDRGQRGLRAASGRSDGCGPRDPGRGG